MITTLRIILVLALLDAFVILLHIHPGWIFMLAGAYVLARGTHHMMFHKRRVL